MCDEKKEYTFNITLTVSADDPFSAQENAENCLENLKTVLHHAPFDCKLQLEDTVNAEEFFKNLLAHNVTKARESVGYTVNQLAGLMKVSPELVVSKETGESPVTVAYVKQVLKACKLPPEWVAIQRN